MKASLQSIAVMSALILGCSFKGAAQTESNATVYINYGSPSVNYTVQTNQTVSLIGFDWSDANLSSGVSLAGQFADGTQLRLLPANGTIGPFANQAVVTGLTNFTLSFLSNPASNQPPVWATFKISAPPCTNASTLVISNYVPADAIVIPASATGNVDVILESSPDLVNWTAANPGVYGPSAATNRFFRVRAAVQ
ncbi:MAG TPA: hypothetical protein VGR14_00135 [Verrucomicrobiae bacterium]|jgi:hypothetical protein|nr:hypothetical protein [Verrucomicrobiae bacterium]